MNYPFAVWTNDSYVSEPYMTRLICEVTLWGILAVVLEIGVNLAGLANLRNANYPNAPGNDIGLFNVDIIYYTVVAVF